LNAGAKFYVFVLKVVGRHPLLHHIIIQTFTFLLNHSGSKFDYFGFHGDCFGAYRNAGVSVAVDTGWIRASDTILAAEVVFGLSAGCSRSLAGDSWWQLSRLVEIVGATRLVLGGWQLLVTVATGELVVLPMHLV
jgi:hypothetical protein